MRPGLVPAVVGCTLAAALLVLPPPAVAAPPTCQGLRATLVGDDRSEELRGTPERDVIVGLGGDDVILGRGGDDVVCGNRGRDLLYGGRGDDRLHGGLDRITLSDEDGSRIRSGDLLRGGPGDDRMVGGLDTRPAADVSPDAILWDTAGRGVRVDLARGTATGAGRDVFEPRRTAVEGSRFDDVVLGSARADTIATGRGDDLVRSRAGDDRVAVDSGGAGGTGGADVVWAGPGDDAVDSAGGRDRIHGGRGDDFLADLGRGPDIVTGGPGGDVVQDQVAAAPGTLLRGGRGRDTVTLFTAHVDPAAPPGAASMDLVSGEVSFEGEEAASFTATAFEVLDLAAYGFAWTVRGTPRDDEVRASGSRGTVFRGRGGDDSFMGSAYDDTFDGGGGTDTNLGMGVGVNTCESVEVDDDSCS